MPNSVRAVRAVLAGALLAAVLPGCATTRFHERERIADEAMTFDTDDSLTYIRTKMEAAREASFGGYGPVAAGGCGCQ